MNPSIAAVLQQNPKLEQIMKRLSGTIDDLHLSVTYLLFDLEATKREREQLQELLASKD